MKKIIFILSTAFLFFGCDEKASEMAKRMEKELKLPVKFEATDSDYCVKSQMDQLYNQYAKLKKEQKAELKKRLAKYTQIKILATEKVQVIEGSEVFLRLGVVESGVTQTCYSRDPMANCNSSLEGCECRDEVVETFKELKKKTIAQETIKNGNDPQTQKTINSSGGLDIQTQGALDQRLLGGFSTVSAKAYENIQKYNDEAFKIALDYEAIKGYVYNINQIRCGKLLDLNSL